MNSLKTLIIAGLMISGSSYAAIIPMPIEILCPDANIHTKTLTLNTGTTGASATQLFLKVHNLRYQGQLSVRLNNKDWVDLSNTSPRITFNGNDGKLGGIGGIQGTVQLTIALDSTWTKTGPQTLDLRFNGTDGHVTAVRVLDVKLLTSVGVNVITDTLQFDDPATWVAPSGYQTSAAVTAGKTLWSQAGKLVDNPIDNQTIKASCASCHFEDGGDLRYFAYSNATILARAQYHGLTEAEGNQIAAYIRDASVDPSRATKYPVVGRPWNPPFQPWAGADDPAKPQNWAAGGGLESVLIDDKEALGDIFKYGLDRVGIERVIDHEGRNTGGKNPPLFSTRSVRIPLQLPDWNMWLPRYAPEDIWADPKDANLVTGLFRSAYNSFKNNATKPVPEFEAKLMDTLDFVNEIRFISFGAPEDPTDKDTALRLADQDLAKDGGLGKRRKEEFNRDEMIEAVTKYEAVKTFNIVREFALEDRAISVLKNDPIRQGERSFPTYDSTVFDIGPHISASNWTYRRGSTIKIGQLTTHQWYYLQLILNTGMRSQTSQNTPIDWDYVLSYLDFFHKYTGINSGTRVLTTLIKMYETRDNGAGVDVTGFTLRVLHPYQLHLPTSYNRDFLDSINPNDKGLWIRTTEAFMHEWLDVMTQYNLSDSKLIPRTSITNPDRHQLPIATGTPSNWNGEGEPYGTGDSGTQNHLDNTWRLIPVMREEGIDEGLLRDFAQWAAKAWPGPSTKPTNWTSLFDAKPPTPGYGNRTIPKVIFLENFEGVTGTTYPFTQMTGVLDIKDSKYVRSDRAQLIPKNGGGIKIGRKTLTNGTTSLIKSIPSSGLAMTSGTKKIRVRTRVATQAITSGSVKYAMMISYNSNLTQTAPTMTLDKNLSGWKFQTYEQTLTIPAGATHITSITLQPTGDSSTQTNTFYFDNVAIIEEPERVDTQAPSAPNLRSVDSTRTDQIKNRNGTKNGTSIYDNAIDIRWDKNTEPDIFGYNIYRSIDGGVSWSSKPINNGPIYAEPGTAQNVIDKDNAIDRDFDPNITYTYAMTAVDRNGNESIKSKSASIKLASIPVTTSTDGKNDRPFSNPSPVWVEPTTAGDIRWFASEEFDCIGYNIYSSIDGIQPYTKLNTALITTLNFLDPNPVVGKKYYVQAVDGFNQTLAAGGTLQNVSVATQSTSGSLPYTLWAQSYGLPTSGTGLGAITASPAGDGIANLVKASLGISPLISGYQNRLSTSTVIEGGTARLTLTYSRPSTGMEAYSYTIEVSPDLTSWSSSTTDVGEISRTDVNGVTTVTTKDLKTGGKRFIRLRVSM